MRFAALVVSMVLHGACAVVATAVVGTAVLGTTALAGSPNTAPAAPSAPMAPRAPSASSPTDGTVIAKPPSLKTCNKAADAKNLTGKDRATFVKECQAGNTLPQD